MAHKWIVAGLSGLVLASALAAGALAQDPGTRAARRGQRIARALDLGPEQREQARALARAARPIVRELRQQIRAERGQGRAHVKELVRGAFQRLQPELRALLATLTPEQRARIRRLLLR